ncbi:MAG: homocysteine S-methyltransferase family protein [Cyanobacteria bacterium P01_A01_bin.123]
MQRQPLSQLSDRLFITDGGLETTLIFHAGLHLPDFAAFDLLKDALGYEALYQYFRTYARLAQTYNVGLVLESATWRASADWGTRLGYSTEALAEANHRAIALLKIISDKYATPQSPMVISGCIGPRGDGYNPAESMNTTEAATYHRPQIETLRQAGADFVTAITMTHTEEAIGIARAAQWAEMPVVISFTVETDGCLPTGQSLKQAIRQVDAVTSSAPTYYMINCAHPFHFAHTLLSGEPWLARLRGIRPNASQMSHAELDNAETLDAGNPIELSSQCGALKRKLPNLTVIGGCCGTDHRHVEEMCKAFVASNTEAVNENNDLKTKLQKRDRASASLP